MTFDRLTLGSFRINGLRDGFFRLDGGAMFGVVPKTLWERIYPADDKNRIRLGLNSILVQSGDFNLIIDTGIGSHFDSKLSGLYTVDNEPGLIAALEKVGLKPEDIDIVINTHLHFDHCGGNTIVSEGRDILPTFPRARYIIQKGEWESALRPNARDRASYLEQYFVPLKEGGQLQLVEGDTEISEGLEVVLASGHTAHHQCVKIESEGQTLFFLGDMVPTSGHVGLPYIMSYDLFPLETMKNKERFYQQAIEEDWTVAFNHDPEYFFGKITQKNRKYDFQPL
jgi:glyoxylase-like metal-dependent hydrolase (beta-lactamase superfamily II)